MSNSSFDPKPQRDKKRYRDSHQQTVYLRPSNRSRRPDRKPRRQPLRVLLTVIEVLAVVGLLWVVWDMWQTRNRLNEEANRLSQQALESDATVPPTSSVVLLPAGHTSPSSDTGARPGEAGEIPSNLLPLVNAYTPPPLPTPAPEHPRRITIPAIDVDHPVVQGDDWEQLKKGVGQHVGSGMPGANGNIVLSAHNDIYGEIFRHLDQLEVGDEIWLETTTRRFVYQVQETRIVEPTEVSVMNPTSDPTVTLISCYPYLVDTQRIIVIAKLK